MPRFTDAELARSFDSAADVYARARPPYPAEAVDWLLPAGARRVLDLGAGTGKFTASLAEPGRGLTVTAVEPSDRMRAQLQATLGDRVTALEGSAESIPLPDGAVDAVLVAQAWHWVDPARAVPEVARVLAPGGRLGLVWNLRDETVPWVAEYGRVLGGDDHPPRPSAERPGIGPPFAPPEQMVTDRWSMTITPERLVELAASRSYVISLDEDGRRTVLDRVRELVANHPELAGRDTIELPYVTACVRADRVT